MNLLQVVKHLQGIALTIPNIRSANEGSVYTIQNGNPHQKYMSFVVSQTTHRTDDLFDYFGLNLFLIDRLTDELEANRLQIQSLAKDCLTNILIKFCNKFYGATYNELVFHPFTEKFTDLCAGQYVQVTLQIPRNIICEDEYSTEYLPNYTLKPLVVEITENGVYEYEPDNFDGYDKVTVTVNVDIPDNFESGFTSGVTYQKSLLSAITITENGEYITDENGVSAITVDVSGYTQDDLDDAYQSGITYQKSLLSAITIDHNGEFINENGYSAITVNVPSTGESIYNQSKSVEYTQNGEYIVNYDNGYTGLESVNININVPQSAYTSGYTQEDLDNAYQSGITYQKSLLSSTIFIENGDYESINGWSGITVDVPQQYTIDDIENAYNSGYEDGLNECGGSGDTPTSGDTGTTTGYFKLYFLEGGTVKWKTNAASAAKTIQYRYNGGEWNNITSTTGGTPITVGKGGVLEFRGDNETYGTSSTYNRLIIGPECKAYGNIMSLINSTNFDNLTTLTQPYTFHWMFYASHIIDASKLSLPATTLTKRCYYNMFAESLRLTAATQTLPATTLQEGCYQRMFNQTKIKESPILPAQTLVKNCYNYMFFNTQGNLNKITCLATNLSASDALTNWVNNAASSGTFTKAQGVTWPTGSSGIPNNWTVIEN